MTPTTDDRYRLRGERPCRQGKNSGSGQAMGGRRLELPGAATANQRDDAEASIEAIRSNPSGVWAMRGANAVAQAPMPHPQEHRW